MQPNKQRTLSSLRKQRGLTQQALADQAGITRETVSMLETGKSAGWPETISKIAAALGVSCDVVYSACHAHVADPTEGTAA